MKKNETAKTSTAELTGQATPEQIQQWKNDPKNTEGIYALTSGGHITYFRNPDRHDVNAALAKANTDKTLDMFEELANATYIGGSEALIENETKFLGLAQFMKTKMEGEKVEVVDL